MVDRRMALGGLVAASLSLGVQARSAPVSATPAVRTRRDVNRLSHNSDDLLALSDAIRKMRRRSDALSWDTQVEIHATHSFRHHRTWRFFPWHRLQLVHFEAIVATLSGHKTFAMPYWNWDSDHIPPALLDPSTPLWHERDADGRSSINAYWKRQGGTFHGRLTDTMGYLIGGPDRPGSAEVNGHAGVHTFVGGDMGSIPTAPRDPLFWFHHANVDRVWAAWQIESRNQFSKYPVAWDQEMLEGFVGTDGRLVRAVPAKSTVDYQERFHYQYDRLNVVNFSVQLRSRTPRVHAFEIEGKLDNANSGEIAVPPDAFYLLFDPQVGDIDILSEEFVFGAVADFQGEPSSTMQLKIAYSDPVSDQIYARQVMFVLPMGHAMEPLQLKFCMPPELSPYVDRLRAVGLKISVSTSMVAESAGDGGGLPALRRLGFEVNSPEAATRRVNGDTA